MQVDLVTRKMGSWKSLDRLLRRIESGDELRPDWIELKADVDPGTLDKKAWADWLIRLHAGVKRGIKTPHLKIKGRKKHLAFWQQTARAGFHDFVDNCWMKPYDAPWVTDFDYIRSYQEGGLEGLDAYGTYSAVLGTWEYGVEDFVRTEIAGDVETIVEPLAGTAEFSYQGHFRHPQMTYVMFDLDPEAKKLVEGRRWIEGTERAFLLGNALGEDVWIDVRKASKGKSLAYIGKQSQNFFDAKDLFRILQWGTKYADHLVLEVSEPYVVEDEPTIDDLTRREMKAVGLNVALEDLDHVTPNPLTHHMSFDLVAWDDADRRTLFEYHDWIGWQPAALSALGKLLDLDMRYFHSAECEWLPLEEGIETSDVRENNSFIMFSRA